MRSSKWEYTISLSVHVGLMAW